MKKQPSKQGTASQLTTSPKKAQYELEVVFLRETSDDLDCLEHNAEFKGMTFNQAAVKQFCKEMQEAYDKVGLGGLFRVKSIKEGSSQFNKLEKKKKSFK